MPQQAISELQALMLSADPESELRAAYADRIASARLAPRARTVGPRRILLAGYNGACNTGADLRTGEIVRQLRAEFAVDGLELGLLVMGTSPLPDWGPLTLERIEGYPPDAVYDLCSHYDAVVVCEGSLFTSTFADSLAMLFTAFLGMATAFGKPAVAYGAEADAMSLAIEEFVRAYAAAALLIARNLPSQQRLEGLGLAAELGTDTGWTYLPAHPEAATPTLRASGWDGRSEVLVLAPTNPFRWPLVADPARALLASLSGEQPRDQYHGMMFFQPAAVANRRSEAFFDSLAAAVRGYAAQRSAGVFPVIVGMEANDRAACEALAERLGAPAPLVSDVVGPDLIVAVLRSASLLVSARYHAVLLSMAAGVPAVGLAYDQRIPALLGEAGHADLVLPVDAPDLAAALAQRLDRLAADAGISADFVRFATERREAQRVMGRRVAAYLRGAAA